MLRRFVSPVASSSALVPQHRTIINVCACPLLGHFGQLFCAKTYALGALTSGPYGTVALLALSYNFCVVGVKHLYYTIEITTRDYVQDYVVQQWLRYLILLSLLVAMESVFIEA